MESEAERKKRIWRKIAELRNARFAREQRAAEERKKKLAAGSKQQGCRGCGR